MSEAPPRIHVSRSLLDNMRQLTDPSLRREWDIAYIREAGIVDKMARSLRRQVKSGHHRYCAVEKDTGPCNCGWTQARDALAAYEEAKGGE